MTSSANELTTERRQRLEGLLAREKEEKDREDRERMERSKIGGVGGFLDGERKRVYAGGMEGGLAERIRRGRGAMIHARQIFDSRGNPTVEVDVHTAKGAP
ncbi:hypothetical protein M422DRAFT_273282 [Sphaerobolus stellatus SS14]|uniref:Phosphopyruvate hydratase n=1 Tax=Sphaerobolus stellatus (strain SS14) TaxID=990650 RepID=A0A0C9T9M3_SPHS4|nr:hypothetical protein M422DRAFT_273282 [Sphaerobolus stellatus SS14]